MAETWEVILWTIVAVVIFIVVLAAILSICFYRRKNRRKKTLRRKGTEWGRSDETDFVKKQVQYNVKSGEAKILDEPDSGVRKSDNERVLYSVKRDEAKILGAVDPDLQYKSEQNEKQAGLKTSDERKLDNAFQTSENETYKESTVMVEGSENRNAEFTTTTTEFNTSENISQKRERLQPLEVVPPRSSGPSHRLVNSHTNLGYSKSYNEVQNPPTIQFQQPVAVVRAMVHPGSARKTRTTKSLPRNCSKLNYKKSFSSSRLLRRKPVAYNWSLEARKPRGIQSWINVPIRYKETEQPVQARRQTIRRSESGSLKTREHRSEDVPLENAWEYIRTMPKRKSARSKERRSLRRQREKRLADSQLASPFDGVYITDSKPRHEGNSAVRANYQGHELKTESRNYERLLHKDGVSPPSKPSHRFASPVSSASTTEQSNLGDYYGQNYKIVKKSEFPLGKAPSSSHQEADMVSISGSEFSDYLAGPPRPNDSSQSEDRWERKEESKDRVESHDKYSRGSYKEYSSRVQNWDKESSRYEMGEERTQGKGDDRTRHLTSFQDTLETLKNGNNKEHGGEKDEAVAVKSPAVKSPWLNNGDNKFRLEHGIPISGVPVLPPQPVFIQTVDTD